MSELVAAQVLFRGRVRRSNDDADRAPNLPVFYDSNDSDLGLRLIDSTISLNLATTSRYLAARVQSAKHEQDPTMTGNSITIAGPAADFTFIKEILSLITKHYHSPKDPEMFKVPEEMIQAINNSIVSHTNTVRFEDASAIINNFPERDLTRHFLAEAMARQCAPMWSTYSLDNEVMVVLNDPKFRETFRPYLETELKRVAVDRQRKDEQQKQELLRLELARTEMLRREEERKQALRRECARRCAEGTVVSELVIELWEDEWPALA